MTFAQQAGVKRTPFDRALQASTTHDHDFILPYVRDLASVLGVLTFLDAITPWSLLTLTFALGLGAAMNAPAWQAIIPELVGDAELRGAVTLNGVGYNVARAVGPALGGIVVATLGSGAVFILNACSFLGVMVVLYRWPRTVNVSALPAEDVFGAMRAGVRYVRHAPAVQAVLLRTGAFIFGGSALWALLPLVARDELALVAYEDDFLTWICQAVDMCD